MNGTFETQEKFFDLVNFDFKNILFYQSEINKPQLTINNKTRFNTAVFRGIGTANKSRRIAEYPFVDRQPKLQPQRRNF